MGGTDKNIRELDDFPEVIDPPELAAYLRVPVSTVYTLARQGKIPGFYVGRRRKFRREEIRKWLQTQPGLTERESNDSIVASRSSRRRGSRREGKR